MYSLLDSLLDTMMAAIAALSAELQSAVLVASWPLLILTSVLGATAILVLLFTRYVSYDGKMRLGIQIMMIRVAQGCLLISPLVLAAALFWWVLS